MLELRSSKRSCFLLISWPANCVECLSYYLACVVANFVDEFTRNMSSRHLRSSSDRNAHYCAKNHFCVTDLTKDDFLSVVMDPTKAGYCLRTICSCLRTVLYCLRIVRYCLRTKVIV